MELAKIKIDEQEYRLGYNFNDLVDAEDVARCNLLTALESLSGEISAAQLRGLLYAMIVPHEGMPKEPAALLRYAGNLIRIDTLNQIIAAIGEACAIAVSAEYAEKYRAAITGKGAVEAPVEAESQAEPQS